MIQLNVVGFAANANEYWASVNDVRWWGVRVAGSNYARRIIEFVSEPESELYRRLRANGRTEKLVFNYRAQQQINYKLACVQLNPF